MAQLAALIPAAGTGARLGQGPKALVEVAGKTLLERAVAAFTGHADEILVAVSPPMVPRVERLAEGLRVRVVLGAATRQESVYNLLRATEADTVLIHDAARPFLSAEVISRVAAAAKAQGAATVVTSVADTLIDAVSGEGIDRSHLKAVQTPQGFRRTLILEAHEAARHRGVAATDDAALVRALGHPVTLVAGSSWLIKVTTPADAELAEALAQFWDRVTPC